MDRRVKERLIGASILVALLVLVVPELLSGPKPAAALPPMLPAATPEPIRNVTVDLSTSKAPTNPDQEPAAPAASAAVAPREAATPNAAPTPAPQHAALVESPAPQHTALVESPAPQHTAPVESPALSPISSGHGWSVQLGSFASRANADNLTRQMKGQGFSAFVLPGGSGASTRYRVRVGPMTDRESAERMAAKLKSLGHISSLVAPAA